MLFSQRIGLTPIAKVLQSESIDDELRNGLWNVLTDFFWCSYCTWRPTDEQLCNFNYLIREIWVHYFKKPTDTIPNNWEECYNILRKHIITEKWFKAYDFIEFALPFCRDKKKFISEINFHLERENSAYRFVDGRIAEIASEEEIASIESAIAEATPYGGVKNHLNRAIELWADKSNPDYRNSIKESISAIESLAKQIGEDKKANFGAILNKLERDGKLHHALKISFSSLYGYTSDADGIRHSLLEEESLTKTDARFMLVCCSAFVNYVIEKIGK